MNAMKGVQWRCDVYDRSDASFHEEGNMVIVVPDPASAVPAVAVVLLTVLDVVDVVAAFGAVEGVWALVGSVGSGHATWVENGTDDGLGGVFVDGQLANDVAIEAVVGLHENGYAVAVVVPADVVGTKVAAVNAGPGFVV